MFVGDGGEVFVVLWLYVQYYGIGGQCFVIVFGYVFGQFVYYVVEYQQGFVVIGQCVVGMVVVGVGGYVEGVVVGSVVGGCCDYVGGYVVLVFEEYVVLVVVGVVGSVGESVEGGGGEQGIEQNLFYCLFFFEVDWSYLEWVSDVVSFLECYWGVKVLNGWQCVMLGEN